jgi:tetratricopeptide (TPR) repeat protein
MALVHFEKVMRLSPFEPMMPNIHAAMAFAHFIVGDYDKASSLAETVLREIPDLHVGLRFAAASHALAGRLDEARNLVDRLRRIDPELRVSDLGDLTPVRRPQDLARYEEGLRRAGLPE